VLRIGIWRNDKQDKGEKMLEVVNYEHPYIFVRCRRTGETYRFLVRHDGALEHEGARFDQGEARRAAIAYLARTWPRDAA
jgi:hypothetical protein